LASIRKTDKLHPDPALTTSGKELYLGVIFGEDPNGARSPRLPCATAARVTPHYYLTYFRLKGSGQLREKYES